MTVEELLKQYLALKKRQLNGNWLPIKCCAKNKIFSCLWHIVLKIILLNQTVSIQWLNKNFTFFSILRHFLTDTATLYLVWIVQRMNNCPPDKLPSSAERHKTYCTIHWIHVAIIIYLMDSVIQTFEQPGPENAILVIVLLGLQ